MLSLHALDFQRPQTHLSFADALADEGDFFRAITEYKRVMHYFPKYEKREWVRFQIGRMYFLGGRYEQSKEYLVPLTITTDKKLLFYTNNFLALAYFENQEFINAHRLFSRLKKKKIKKLMVNSLRVRAISCLMCLSLGLKARAGQFFGVLFFLGQGIST